MPLGFKRELERDWAATQMGESAMQYFFKIVLPLSRPIIAGAAIINFTYAWNMYLWPMIVAMEDRMKTVQVEGSCFPAQEQLYRVYSTRKEKSYGRITLVPYHLWANREAGPMVVWLNVVC